MLHVHAGGSLSGDKLTIRVAQLIVEDAAAIDVRIELTKLPNYRLSLKHCWSVLSSATSYVLLRRALGTCLCFRIRLNATGSGMIALASVPLPILTLAPVPVTEVLVELDNQPKNTQTTTGGLMAV